MSIKEVLSILGDIYKRTEDQRERLALVEVLGILEDHEEYEDFDDSDI